MFEMNVKALAKINLGLDVLGKRADNYHEVRMVMQTIHLYDRIYLRRTRSPGIKVTTNLFYLPVNENNLVYKAAKLLMDEFHIRDGIFINLKKYIPVSAGLAGGSSDAAAILYGVNRMFGLGLSRTQLMERGVLIGADVPYCLMRGTALAEGIGERLTPLPPMPKCRVLIAKPAINVSTKAVYGNLKLNQKINHPDIDRIIETIEKKDLHGMATHMGNILETVTVRQYPVIAQLKEVMMENGAIHAMMSGSGPTVFGLFEKKDEIREAYRVVREQGLAKQIFITDIFNNRRRG